MSIRMPAKLGTLLAASCLLAWGAPSAGAQESAPPPAEVHYLYYNGTVVGSLTWNQDPAGTVPGDALMLCDLEPDGWGLEVELVNGGLVEIEASTRGHSSPWCTPWKTRNLPENRTWPITVWMVQGTNYRTLDTVYVNS